MAQDRWVQQVVIKDVQEKEVPGDKAPVLAEVVVRELAELAEAYAAAVLVAC